MLEKLQLLWNLWPKCPPHLSHTQPLPSSSGHHPFGSHVCGQPLSGYYSLSPWLQSQRRHWLLSEDSVEYGFKQMGFSHFQVMFLWKWYCFERACKVSYSHFSSGLEMLSLFPLYLQSLVENSDLWYAHACTGSTGHLVCLGLGGGNYS